MSRAQTQKNALAALNYDLFVPEDLTPPSPATIHAKIRQHTTKAVSIPSELTDAGDNGLPSVAELYRRFDMFNWLYFDGKLPRSRIEYSGRMTSAGSYSSSMKLIRMGRRYHELFPEEINDTLKHEMLHIRHHHHDSVFKKEAARIGASVRARTHPLLQKPPRYIYLCPGCGKEYPRQRRLRMSSCGDCSRGGRFDSRFKLTLVESRARLKSASSGK
ncbi:MAG: SprT-like domain-containing protein [Candidatus Zixiibacteriota bacterium]